MGHRALVAYRQPDGTYALHYAHWGEGLADAIGPTTPLGGPADRPDPERTGDALDVDVRGGYDPPVATRVDPRPVARDADPRAVLDAVGPTVESLVVVSPSYETATYLVCSLDPTTGSDARAVDAPGGDGSSTASEDIVFARPQGDPSSLRGWFVETKSRLSAAVADGSLSREAARATLRRSLAARATVYPPDDASFLPGG